MSTHWLSWIFFAQQQPQPAGGAEGGTPPYMSVLPFILIGILFYLMLVRPERRKRAELDSMLKSLKKNDRVVTIGGIFGTVVQASQDADEVTLRIDESNNTRIRVLRSSISRVLTPSSPAESVGGETQGST